MYLSYAGSDARGRKMSKPWYGMIRWKRLRSTGPIRVVYAYYRSVPGRPPILTGTGKATRNFANVLNAPLAF